RAVCPPAAAAGGPAGPGGGELEAAVGDAGTGGAVPALERQPRALPAHPARPGLGGRARAVAARLFPRRGYRRLPGPASSHPAAPAAVHPGGVTCGGASVASGPSRSTTSTFGSFHGPLTW